MCELVDPPAQFPQTTVECEGCGAEFDVQWFCKNCSASLCDACKEEHSRHRVMKKHDVVPRSGSVLWTHGSWKLSEQCQKHKGHDLITYCNGCKTPCCLTCLEEEHKSHDWTRLSTKYLDAESRLNSLADDLSKSSISTIQNEISNLKEKIDSCNDDFYRVSCALNKTEEKLKNVLKQSFDQLRKDLADEQNRCISNLNESIKKFEHQIAEIEILVASIEQKIRTGGLDLIEYNPEPPKILSCHSNIPTPVPCFVLNDDILDELTSNVGDIFFSDRIDKTCDASVRHDTTTKKKSNLMILEKGGGKMELSEIEKINSFQAVIHGKSIKSVDDDTAWISSFGSETMYLYGSSGNQVKSITIQGSWGIRDIVVQKNGDIIVLCNDMKVRRVSVDDEIATLINTAPFLPKGVCLTDREEIVVCMSCQKDKNHVAVYTSDGKSKVREITARDSNNERLITNPCAVVFNDGQLIVVNHHKNVVSMDQHSDKVHWVYDGGHAKFYPLGICRDEISNLLVTDENHCIHYIDEKGFLLHVFEVKHRGLQQPWGIDVDHQSGKVLCGSLCSHNIFFVEIFSANGNFILNHLRTYYGKMMLSKDLQ